MKNILLKILQDIWPFSELSVSQLKLIFDLGVVREYRKGEIIYHQNQDVTSLYILLSGKVVTFSVVDGKEKQLEVLHRGKIFGIISLMTGSTHSVTAKGLFDSLILEIPHQNFKILMERIPILAFYFSKILAKRVKARSGRKEVFENKVIGFVCPEDFNLNTSFGNDFAKVFREHTGRRIRVIEIGDRPFTTLREDCSFFHSQEIDRRKWALTISEVMERYSYVLLIININDPHSIFRFLTQVDIIIFLAFRNALSLKKAALFIKKMMKIFKLKAEDLKVIVVDDRPLEFGEVKKILGCDVFGTLSIGVRSVHRQSLIRFVRTLGNMQVGLVLGSGGALGISHIGVIEMLEENNIPIDIVCGSSVGALVAALWVSGYTPSEMKDIAYRFKEKNPFFSLRDINVPTRSIFKGKRFEKMLDELFGEKTFQSVNRPLRIVSFEFWSKKEMIMKEGKLKDAVRASCSFPGIFSPLIKGEYLLLDGGILQPLPVSVLVHEGIPKIIAVSLSAAYSDAAYLQKKKSIFSRLRLNILDFVFGSIESMQAQLIKYSSLYADEVLCPRVEDLNWMEVSNINELIQRGRNAVAERIESIKEIVFKK